MALWSARSKRAPTRIRDLPGGFSRHLQDALFPPWIIGRGSMTAWEARIVGGGVGAGVGPVVRRRARPRDPCATIRRHPAPGVGAGHAAETHHGPRGGT